MRTELHQSRCSEWKKLNDQWTASALPKKRWCNENDVNIRQLRYWQHVLSREDAGQQTKSG